MNYMEKNFLHSQEMPFEFTDSGKKNISDSVGLKKISEETDEIGKIKIKKTQFSADGIVKYAVRYEFKCGENTKFIADKTVSDGTAIGVRSKFAIDYNANFNCNIAAKNRLVLRKDEIGEKFFRLEYILDNESIMEKAGLLLPDKISDKEIGLTFYSGIYKFGCEHTALYGICTDAENSVGMWHFVEDNGFKAEPPTREGGYKISYADGAVTVCNTLNPDETVTIKL